MEIGTKRLLSATSLGKNQFSMKKPKQLFPFVQSKRKRHLLSAEQNGSVTSVFHALDGEHLTVWTVSNDVTTDTEVPLFVLVTARFLLPVVTTPLDSEKLWFKTPWISKPLTLKPKQHASVVESVDESENTSIHVPMNSVFVSSTEGGISDANYKSKASCC